MTIRTRLTLWYSGMLLASLLLMGVVLYYELVYEHRAEVPPEQRERAPKQMADILFLYGAPTLVLLLVGGWFLMRRTLAPVIALSEAAERVHSENLRERLPRPGNGDELDSLTGVFNDMLARLDDSFRRIRQFTLHASHELKTPLTILRGEIETLQRDVHTTPSQRDALAGMLDEIQRLARIVDDLSLLTKAGAAEVPLAREPVRLDELVREACEDARILAEPHGITVELGACDEVAVSGDRHRLRQLLLNLADNAVKHNQRKGRVNVILRRDDGQAHIEIANTGPGISADQLPLVFDPFFRGTEAQRAKRDGCGLGLSISQWIVHAHEGTVAFSSDDGSVTTVKVSLPLSSDFPCQVQPASNQASA
ncbi:MAG: HAMP domain-containing histidine kinase [Verrucomicrobia bacterium]|nr:HAMP domain-containing histidine kinase [Verrucomicrobiota bacterium]